jgi:DNA replicative helicase MCM subunit Mcm2 (Cdc46/Mcm family)
MVEVRCIKCGKVKIIEQKPYDNWVYACKKCDNSVKRALRVDTREVGFFNNQMREWLKIKKLWI